MSDYEIVTARCPECVREMKLSFFKGESHRHTYCMKCGKAVLWKKVEGL